MDGLDSLLAERLTRLERAGRRRVLRAAEPRDRGRVLRDEAELLDFSSNDYLGLARHPLLIARAREWTARHGAGSGASRLVTGTSETLLALEARTRAVLGDFARGAAAERPTPPAPDRRESFWM